MQPASVPLSVRYPECIAGANVRQDCVVVCFNSATDKLIATDAARVSPGSR